MSIFSRSKVLVATLFAFTGLAVAHCSVDGCLRFSDCPQGMTCGNGICVVASIASSNDEAGTSLDASAIDGAPAVVDGATQDASDTGAVDSAADADDAADGSDSGDAGALDGSADASLDADGG